MYLTSLHSDSHGHYGYMAECDTDAVWGTMYEEHITRHFTKKKSAVDRVRSLAHILDWDIRRKV